MTVPVDTMQVKKHTLFVRLGVIRTDGRGGNVAPKVVYGLAGRKVPLRVLSPQTKRRTLGIPRGPRMWLRKNWGVV